jgi:hypothetical protein
MRSSDSRPSAPTVLLAVGLVFAAAYSIGLVALRKPDGRIVAGDAVHYYVYVRSLIFDWDLQFENDYLGLVHLAPDDPAVARLYRRSPTRHVSNMMSIGPALLWMPAVLVLSLVVRVANLFGLGYPLDGFGRAFQAAAGFSGIAAATGGALLSERMCRRLFPGTRTAGPTLTIWLGTSALYYSLVSPTYSHAASMLVCSAFFLYWVKTLGETSTRRFLILGLLGGWCALVRFQDAVFLVVVALDVFEELAKGQWRAAAWSAAGTHAASCALGALFAVSPQILVWTVLYGTPFTIPQGHEWMQWSSPRFAEVLFSDANGLLSWTPVVLPALVGLALLGHDRRRIAVGLALSFVFSLYANAAIRQWWAGEAFGARRFVSCFPVFAVGLTALSNRLPPRVARIGALLFIASNALLLLQYQLQMHGFSELAPAPRGWFGLAIARFAVPAGLIQRWVGK